jgi:hypothetical protein
MDTPRPPPKQTIEGEVVRLSRAGWVLAQLALGVFLAAAGAFLLLSGRAAPPAYFVWIETCLGAALACVSVVQLLIHFRYPRLVLGRDRLVVVRPNGRVILNLPYAMLAEVQVAGNFLVRYIGLRLKEGAPPGGPDTQRARARFQQRYGYDAIIPAELPLSQVRELAERIRARVAPPPE